MYPPEIGKIAASPRRVGKTAGENCIGASASFSCGSFVRFSLRIDPQSKEIQDIRFVSNGCGYTVAAAELVAGDALGKYLTDLHGFSDSMPAKYLTSGDYPATRRECLEMCIDAIKAALADFRELQIEEYLGDKPLICTCFGISEERVDEVITVFSPATTDEVTARCNAGGGCGSCRMLIQEMIDGHVAINAAS